MMAGTENTKPHAEEVSSSHRASNGPAEGPERPSRGPGVGRAVVVATRVDGTR